MSSTARPNAALFFDAVVVMVDGEGHATQALGGDPSGGGSSSGGDPTGAMPPDAVVGPAPRVRVARTTLARALRKGLRIRVTTSGAGRVTARLLQRRQVIGARSARVGPTGRVRLRVRISKVGVRRLRRRRSARLTVVVAFQPAGGGSTRTTRSRLTLRRR